MFVGKYKQDFCLHSRCTVALTNMHSDWVAEFVILLGGFFWYVTWGIHIQMHSARQLLSAQNFIILLQCFNPEGSSSGKYNTWKHILKNIPVLVCFIKCVSNCCIGFKEDPSGSKCWKSMMRFCAFKDYSPMNIYILHKIIYPHNLQPE